MTRRNVPPSRAEDAPPKPKHWRSARQIEEVYIGRAKDMHQLLPAIREALIGDVVHAMTCSREEAATLIDANLIGRKKPRRGPEAIAASPDAVRLISGLTPRDQAGPPKPPGWRSAVELSKAYRASHHTIARLLQTLQADLVDVLTQAGYSETAHALVQNHLIGIKKPATGSETIAASPDAIRLAEDLGMLRRKAHAR